MSNNNLNLYTDIIKLCRTNKNINDFCKANPDKIAKYILKNDYGFTSFPKGIDYANIVKYFQITVRPNDKIIYKNLSDKQRACVKNKVSTIMKEFKTNELHSSNGKLVKNPKQAIAIALSMAKTKCL